jgi:hypothetical protein
MEGLDQFDEFPRVGGLEEVIVSAEQECLVHVVRSRGGGEHQD